MDLLRHIDITISRGTRSKSIFGRRFQTTNNASNHRGKTSKLLKTGGQASLYVDFFVTTVAFFKSKVDGFVSR